MSITLIVYCSSHHYQPNHKNSNGSNTQVILISSSLCTAVCDPNTCIIFISSTSSIFHLPSSIFHLPSSIFHLPSSHNNIDCFTAVPNKVIYRNLLPGIYWFHQEVLLALLLSIFKFLKYASCTFLTSYPPCSHYHHFLLLSFLLIVFTGCRGTVASLAHQAIYLVGSLNQILLMTLTHHARYFLSTGFCFRYDCLPYVFLFVYI